MRGEGGKLVPLGSWLYRHLLLLLVLLRLCWIRRRGWDAADIRTSARGGGGGRGAASSRQGGKLVSLDCTGRVGGAVAAGSASASDSCGNGSPRPCSGSAALFSPTANTLLLLLLLLPLSQSCKLVSVGRRHSTRGCKQEEREGQRVRGVRDVHLCWISDPS